MEGVDLLWTKVGVDNDNDARRSSSDICDADLETPTATKSCRVVETSTLQSTSFEVGDDAQQPRLT